MEEKGCLGMGCGCFSILIIVTIVLTLVVCGLIVWAIFGVADVQNQLNLGVQLLTALVPIV